MRVFYVSDPYTQDYLFITDDPEEYRDKVKEYANNLNNSQQLNSYIMGSSEMTPTHYERMRKTVEALSEQLAIQRGHKKIHKFGLIDGEKDD
jgi:hypothetical protein